MIWFYFFVAFSLYGYILWFTKYKFKSYEKPTVDAFGLIMMLILCLAWMITLPIAIIGFGFHLLAKWIRE